MPDSTAVLTALRNELERAPALIRRPSVAGALPPMFVEPDAGPPAPGEREGTEAGALVVVTLRLSSEPGLAPGQAFVRIYIIDLIIRSITTAGLKQGRALDAAIRARLVERANYGTGVLLDEGGAGALFVHDLRVFAGLGPVLTAGGVRTEAAKYALEVLAQ